MEGPSFLQCVAELHCSPIETGVLKLRCSKMWLSTKEGIMLTDLFLNSLANKLPRRKEKLVCRLGQDEVGYKEFVRVHRVSVTLFYLLSQKQPVFP